MNFKTQQQLNSQTFAKLENGVHNIPIGKTFNFDVSPWMKKCMIDRRSNYVRNQNLTLAVNRYRSQVKSLKTVIKSGSLSDIINSVGDSFKLLNNSDEKTLANEFVPLLLDEMFKSFMRCLDAKNVNGFRWSSLIRKYWFVIQQTSPKCLRISRK